MTAAQQKMNMIAHQRPGVTGCCCLIHQTSVTGNETLVVLSVSENRRALYSSYDDMMESAGCVNAALSGH
jgi:hypothetical protein